MKAYRNCRSSFVRSYFLVLDYVLCIYMKNNHDSMSQTTKIGIVNFLDIQVIGKRNMPHSSSYL